MMSAMRQQEADTRLSLSPRVSASIGVEFDEGG